MAHTRLRALSSPVFSVVLDACVLYPAYLRDTLLRMAATEMYRPLWTATILDELLANLPETMEPERSGCPSTAEELRLLSEGTAG